MRIALSYQRVDPTKGGAETYVVDLCSRLIGAGHRVELFANEWRSDTLPTGVTTQHVPLTGLAKWQRIQSFATNSEQALIEARDRYDCSVGFINTWHQDVLIPQGGVHGASLEANAQRFPQGWRRQSYLLGKQANPKRWLYRSIEAKQYDPARGTRIIAVSRMVQRHLARYQGVHADRVDVIPNAIDASRLAVPDPVATRRDFRDKFGLNDNDLVALFVGHNYALKGLAPLLYALATRDPQARRIHLVACGGTDIAPYQSIVNQLGLTDRVHLAGFQPEIRPLFWGSDFFVSPTFYDPCSLVVFEALACGLPVITTACNGAGEVMTEGREGFVISHPQASEELVSALNQMTNDKARSSMSDHAKALGLEQSMDRHVRQLLEVFKRVAASKTYRSSQSVA